MSEREWSTRKQRIDPLLDAAGWRLPSGALPTTGPHCREEHPTRHGHAERSFHEAAQVGVLRSLHDDLDAAVALAYGWPADLDDEELLSRLVALNRERAAEEAAGTIRWLRPDFQAPALGTLSQVESETAEAEDAAAEASPVALPAFPTEAGPRLLLLRDSLRAAGAPLRSEELAARFANVTARELGGTLELLVQLGLLVEREGAFAAV